MDAARWAQVKALFQALCDLEPADRPGVLEAACRSDSELRAAVEPLLDAHVNAGPFLDSLPPIDHDEACSASALDDAILAPPSEIGAYRIVRELGRGGMGTVYLAERDEPGMRKIVAIKVVRPGMDSQFVLRRFRTERQILAALEHPGIACLYDGGTTDEGLPYFVMEYVAGENLLDYCDTRRVPLRDRLQLFRLVCEAVQYAHQSFVVHRDLKPSNILVTADGKPKLLDFGIAKLLTPQAAGEAVDETTPAARVMTPQYASPEQVQGRPVTTAADVYSLGVILYELLCGHRPYRVSSRQAADLERTICEEHPVAPSIAVARTETIPAVGADEPLTITPEIVSANRGAPPGKLRRLLRHDLDNIVLKALRKDPQQRYATAADLAEDVRRHLDGFPVAAQPDGRLYRAAKFSRRHRTGIAATAVAVLSLIAGLALALWQGTIARAERDRARSETVKVQQVSAFLSSLFESSYPRRANGETLTARDLLDTGAARVDRELSEQPDVQAAMLALLGSVYTEMSLYAQAEPLLERSLTIRERILGDHHLDVAESLYALGRLKRSLAEYESAQRFLERAVAIREAGLPREDRALAETLSELGNTLYYRGEYTQGRLQLARAVAIEEKAGGANLLKWVTNLSNFDVALGDLESAKHLLERALAMGAQAGAGDAQVDVTLLNLAFVLREQEDYAGASRLYERALVTTQRVYGSEHPASIYALAEVGDLYLVMGEHAKARDALARSVTLGEKVLGPEHPALVSPLTYSGRLLVAEGKAHEALPFFERAVSLREKTAGGLNPNELAEALVNLAEIRCTLEQPELADEILRRALAIQRQVLVPGHRALVRTLTALGRALAQTGKPAQAREFLQEAVQIARKWMPERHSQRLLAEATFAELSRSIAAAAQPGR